MEPEGLPFACKWIIEKDVLNKATKRIYSTFDNCYILNFSKTQKIFVFFQLILHEPSDLSNFNDPSETELQIWMVVSDMFPVISSYSFGIGNFSHSSTQEYGTKFGADQTLMKINVPFVSKKEILNPENDYLVNEKMVINFDGAISFGRGGLQKISSLNVRDFSIIVRNKFRKRVIKVNKEELKTFSPLFAAKLEAENDDFHKLEVTQFPCNVVKAAIAFHYGTEIPVKDIDKNIADFLHFADYYRMISLKNYISKSCTITAKNIDEISKMALKFNAEKLHKRCFHFFVENLNDSSFVDKSNDDFISLIHEVVSKKLKFSHRDFSFHIRRCQ